MKQVNKKGISEIVAIILIISITMIGFFSVQNWYGGYVNNIETKKLQSLSGPSSESFEIVSFEQEGSTYELKIRSFTPEYTTINDLKINNQECSLPDSNVILGNSLSTIEVSCPSYNSTNEIALITNFGILNYKQKLDIPYVAPITEPIDNTPDPFSFSDIDELPCMFPDYIDSEILTITGFEGSLLVQIINIGESTEDFFLRVNGGSWVKSAEINSGDTLQIRVYYDSNKDYQITLGSYSTIFSVGTYTLC